MKDFFRAVTRVSVIGFLMVFVWSGCAGVGQKFDQIQTSVGDKFGELKSTLKEKMQRKTAEENEDAKAGAADQSDQSTQYFIHTARWSGETLACVAEWYTGDPQNCRALAEINPDVNPEKVAVGSEIFIPVNLLKTRKQMPQHFPGTRLKDSYAHTVRWPGESLSLIAGWYTGSTRNWRKLAEINPAINPNRIKAGDVILIPAALLKTRDALPQKVAAQYTPEYFAHTVTHDGEKLADIAGWYTGDATNWKELAKVNPKLNPEHLTVGNEIFIPKNLLKTRKPIPPAAAAQTPATPEKSPGASDAEASPAKEDPIKLFGPKQFPKS